MERVEVGVGLMQRERGQVQFAGRNRRILLSNWTCPAL
jgi:hypothetical protein